MQQSPSTGYASWAVPAARAWMVALLCILVTMWGLLLAYPPARSSLFPAGTADSSLWSFLLPDLLLVGFPTLYALRCLGREVSQARWTAWLVVGGLAYTGVWSLGASLYAWEAPLGPMVRLPCAFFQAVVAWTLQPRDSWFRGAAPATPLARAFKTMADAALFTSVFLLLAGVLIRLFEDTYGIPRFDAHVGPVVIVALVALLVFMNLGGLISGLWLVWKGDGTPLPIDTANTLVTVGPYRWIRNPMASFGITQGIFLGLALGSWLTVLYTLGGAVFWHTFVRPIEEHDLEKRFGAAYLDYRARVPLWVPRPW